MSENYLTHLKGLFNERAGFDFVKRGRRADAEQHFQRSLDIYMNDWSATAKYIQHLEERSSIALSGLYDDGAGWSEAPLGGRCITTTLTENDDK